MPHASRLLMPGSPRVGYHDRLEQSRCRDRERLPCQVPALSIGCNRGRHTIHRPPHGLQMPHSGYDLVFSETINDGICQEARHMLRHWCPRSILRYMHKRLGQPLLLIPMFLQHFPKAGVQLLQGPLTPRKATKRGPGSPGLHGKAHAELPPGGHTSLLPRLVAGLIINVQGLLCLYIHV